MSRQMSRKMNRAIPGSGDPLSLRPPQPAPLGRWRSAMRGASSANTRLSIAIRIVPRATPSTSAVAACVRLSLSSSRAGGGNRAFGGLIRRFQSKPPSATQKLSRKMNTAPCDPPKNESKNEHRPVRPPKNESKNEPVHVWPREVGTAARNCLVDWAL